VTAWKRGLNSVLGILIQNARDETKIYLKFNWDLSTFITEVSELSANFFLEEKETVPT
jgi:hypothetical protein